MVKPPAVVERVLKNIPNRIFDTLSLSTLINIFSNKRISFLA
jgi:hypothetical protein